MTTERPWRCFVAVPIGEDLRAALAGCLDAWRRRPDLDGLSWTDPAAWHVTLAFLGAVEPGTVARVEAVVRRVAAAHEAVDLATGGLGAFPQPRRARVAWYGVTDRDGALGAVAGELATGLRLDGTGPYRPHLTLARARSAAVDVRAWLADAGPSVPDGRLEVSRIELLRSHLGGGPARYETLASVPLG